MKCFGRREAWRSDWVIKSNGLLFSVIEILQGFLEGVIKQINDIYHERPNVNVLRSNTIKKRCVENVHLYQHQQIFKKYLPPLMLLHNLRFCKMIIRDFAETSDPNCINKKLWMQFLYSILKIQRSWLIKINYYISVKGKVTLYKRKISLISLLTYTMEEN